MSFSGSAMRKGFHFVKAAWAALAAAVATTVYYVVQTAIFPHISRWKCHFITIGFCTVMSFLIALIIWRRREIDVELLKHEKTNFENLIENIPGLTCIVDSDRKLVRWNSSFQRALGYSAAELSRMSGPETLAEDYRELVPKAMGAAWTKGHAEIEAAWLTKSGERIPCYLSGVRILEDNKPCVLTVGIDISDQKRAQEELRKSEVQYSRLLANLPDVTWTMDAEGRVTYVSPNLEGVFGYSPDEVLAGGKELRISRIHPDDRDLVNRSYQALFQEDRPFDVDYRMRRVDGNWVWVRSRSLRTYEHDGLLFADGILSDITERKQAERINSQLASIVTSSVAAIIGKTVDGTIVSWNPGAGRIFGYAASDAIGKHISMLVAPEKLHEVPEVIAKVLRGQQVPRFDSICVRQDSSRIPVSLAISAITDKMGRVLGISTIANDISLQRNAERELLRAKEAAEAATRAKSQFLANISHELRTPMNGILGMTDLALDTTLDAEQREYLLTIQSSGIALLEMINKLLDFTNVESGALRLNTVSFNLQEIVRRTVRPFVFQGQQVGLEVLCQVSRDLPAAVVGDPERLRQVLVNLVGNAIKFTHLGKVVVDVTCGSHNDHTAEFRFAVSDTGIGIPAEKHAAMFEPFTQNDGSSTRKYGGTGLGLSVCKRLVELMGGKIWLESEPGRGSTFYFTVPLGLPEEPALNGQQISAGQA
ncbi:MAG: PAS domain S-box protein [Candidatus Korobacteraceae bacterium]